MNDWLDDMDDMDIDFPLDIDDLPIEKGNKKIKNTGMKPRLICRDYSEKISDLVFHYEHPNKNYGRCLLKRAKNKKNEKCDLCGKIIKEKHYYYPVLWDRIIGHSFCSKCFLDAFDKFIELG